MYGNTEKLRKDVSVTPTFFLADKASHVKNVISTS